MRTIHFQNFLSSIKTVGNFCSTIKTVEATVLYFLSSIKTVGACFGRFVGVRVGGIFAYQTCTAYKATESNFLKFVCGLWALGWGWQTFFGSIDRLLKRTIHLS